MNITWRKHIFNIIEANHQSVYSKIYVRKEKKRRTN